MGTIRKFSTAAKSRKSVVTIGRFHWRAVDAIHASAVWIGRPARQQPFTISAQIPQVVSSGLRVKRCVPRKRGAARITPVIPDWPELQFRECHEGYREVSSPHRRDATAM
jgi:hypothetical protein